MSEPAEPDNSPTISELFAADPLSLTRETRKPIIEFYRSNRVKFLSGGKTEKLPKPKSKGTLPAIDLELGDLEL